MLIFCKTSNLNPAPTPVFASCAKEVLFRGSVMRRYGGALPPLLAYHCNVCVRAGAVRAGTVANHLRSISGPRVLGSAGAEHGEGKQWHQNSGEFVALASSFSFMFSYSSTVAALSSLSFTFRFFPKITVFNEKVFAHQQAACRI